MGEINGFELARFVRQNERFAAIPILFLTTQNQLEAHIESARAGGDDHLIKPVNPQLLVATIAGKLERYRIFQRLLRNDGLTQILNHSHFMEYAQRSVRIRSKKFAQVLTIFDIDGLSRVNDAYGYAVGDRTILALVQIIKWTFRHTEIIGRIGGDEIAVLDDSLSAQETVELVNGLLEQFAAVPHKAAGQIFKVTASAGVSQVTSDGNLQMLLERSSGALARAKALGQNQVVLM
jgi:diguanylate cyclase (GGDEF)-like protein